MIESQAELGTLLGVITASIITGWLIHAIFIDLPYYVFTRDKTKQNKTRFYYIASAIKYLLIGLIFIKIDYVTMYPAWIGVWVIGMIGIVIVWRKLSRLKLL